MCDWLVEGFMFRIYWLYWLRSFPKTKFDKRLAKNEKSYFATCKTTSRPQPLSRKKLSCGIRPPARGAIQNRDSFRIFGAKNECGVIFGLLWWRARLPPTAFWRDAGSIRSLAHCRQRLHGPRAKGMSRRPACVARHDGGCKRRRTLEHVPSIRVQAAPARTPPRCSHFYLQMTREQPHTHTGHSQLMNSPGGRRFLNFAKTQQRQERLKAARLLR